MALEIKLEDVNASLPSRLTGIIWGDAGCGKTTLAATSPGNKLWLLFDLDGDISIRHMPNIKRIDLSKANYMDIMNAATQGDPFGISQYLAQVDTVVVDSLTKFNEHAMRYAVSRAPSSASFRPSMELPGIQAYGMRNVHVSMFFSNMLRVTGYANKHCLFLTHESAPDMDEKGNILSVAMMLGGQLPNVTSKDISEVWHMRDDNKKRMIAIRPERMRKPMKSRIFDMNSDTSFVWKYNANTLMGDTITEWWQQWQAGDGAKLPLPK
jgi:hypothetical protein